MSGRVLVETDSPVRIPDVLNAGAGGVLGGDESLNDLGSLVIPLDHHGVLQLEPALPGVAGIFSGNSYERYAMVGITGDQEPEETLLAVVGWNPKGEVSYVPIGGGGFGEAVEERIVAALEEDDDLQQLFAAIDPELVGEKVGVNLAVLATGNDQPDESERLKTDETTMVKAEAVKPEIDLVKETISKEKQDRYLIQMGITPGWEGVKPADLDIGKNKAETSNHVRLAEAIDNLEVIFEPLTETQTETLKTMDRIHVNNWEELNISRDSWQYLLDIHGKREELLDLGIAAYEEFDRLDAHTQEEVVELVQEVLSDLVVAKIDGDAADINLANQAFDLGLRLDRRVEAVRAAGGDDGANGAGFTARVANELGVPTSVLMGLTALSLVFAACGGTDPSLRERFPACEGWRGDTCVLGNNEELRKQGYFDRSTNDQTTGDESFGDDIGDVGGDDGDTGDGGGETGGMEERGNEDSGSVGEGGNNTSGRADTEKPKVPEPELELDEDRLAFAAMLAGLPLNAMDENITFMDLAIEGWQQVKSNQNAKIVVYYNAERDRFLKLDTRTTTLLADGSLNEKAAIANEFRGIRASVETALGISGKELDDWVVLRKIPVGAGKGQLAAVETRYLGVNTIRALNKGLISADDLPVISELLYQHTRRVYKNFKIFNKDLNAGNVLINVSNKGEVRLIVIDWTKTTGGYSKSIQASAFRKFFRSVLSSKSNPTRQVILNRTAQMVGNKTFREVLVEVARRDAIGNFAKQGLKAVKRTGPLVLAVIGAGLMVKDAKAAFDEAEQRGETFHIDIALFPLLEAGMPSELVNKAFDEMRKLPVANGFYELPYIPLSGPALEKIRNEVAGGARKELWLYNFFDERDPWLPVKIYTGIEVVPGQNGEMQFFRLGTDQQERLSDGDVIHLGMMGRSEGGELGFELWECEFRVDYQHEGKGNVFEYAIVPQRLVLFVPND